MSNVLHILNQFSESRSKLHLCLVKHSLTISKLTTIRSGIYSVGGGSRCVCVETVLELCIETFETVELCIETAAVWSL